MASIRKMKRKDGSTSYHADIRIKGYPRQSKSFTHLRKAREWVQLVESKMREGELDFLIKNPTQTLGSLIDMVMEKIDSLPHSDKKKLVMHSTFWKEKLGFLQVGQINIPQVNRIRDELVMTQTRYKRPMSGATVNSYLCSIRFFMNEAVSRGWIKSSPLRDLKWENRNPPICRFLSNEELTALLSAAKSSSSPYLYTVVKLALSTGMRKQEILSLKKSQIHLSLGRIYLYDTKEQKPRGVFLSSDTIELLRSFIEKNHPFNEYLFPNGSSHIVSVNYAWKKALVAANISNFRFHDLRHTCASYLAMNGASIQEIKEVLGHKNIQMTMRYAHLSDSHVSNVVQKMNDCYLNVE